MSLEKYKVGTVVMATIPQFVADSVLNPGLKSAYDNLVKTPKSGVVCKILLNARHKKNQYVAYGVRFNLLHRDGVEKEVTIPINSVEILGVDETAFA